MFAYPRKKKGKKNNSSLFLQPPLYPCTLLALSLSNLINSISVSGKCKCTHDRDSNRNSKCITLLPAYRPVRRNARVVFPRPMVHPINRSIDFSQDFHDSRNNEEQPTLIHIPSIIYTRWSIVRVVSQKYRSTRSLRFSAMWLLFVAIYLVRILCR